MIKVPIWDNDYVSDHLEGARDPLDLDSCRHNGHVFIVSKVNADPTEALASVDVEEADAPRFAHPGFMSRESEDNT